MHHQNSEHTVSRQLLAPTTIVGTRLGVLGDHGTRYELGLQSQHLQVPQRWPETTRSRGTGREIGKVWGGNTTR